MILAAHDRRGVQLAIVGDSIVQNLEADKEVWDRDFVPYHPLGLGISGDTTANVLWRVDNGELDGMSPSGIVLLVGTNNTRKSKIAFWSVQADVDAIVKTIDTLHAKCPGAHIVLVSVLPTGQWAWKEKKDAEIDERLAARYGGGEYPYVLWADVRPLFLDADGRLKATLYEGITAQVHPSQEGDRVLADAILSKLQPYLKTGETQ
jgi:lysophospholipase L1-like esterase